MKQFAAFLFKIILVIELDLSVKLCCADFIKQCMERKWE